MLPVSLHMLRTVHLAQSHFITRNAWLKVWTGSRIQHASFFVPWKRVPSSRHWFTRFCTWHRPHFRNPFPPCHSCRCHRPYQVQDRCATIYIPLKKIHGRMAVPRISTPPQVMSSRRSSSTRFWSTRKIRQLMTRTTWRKSLWNNWPWHSNQWHIQLASRQKALRPIRTSMTSKYGKRWHHRCIYGNDEKMKDKLKLVALNEKA